MHSAQHASNKSINIPTLFDQRDKGRDAAFIVRRMAEMREDDTLKRLDLVLDTHKVRDGLVSKMTFA